MEFTEGIVVLVIITAFFSGLLALGFNEAVRRRIFCPRSRTTADVEVVQRYHHPEKPVRVRSCSLLPNPKKVDCEQDCLKTTA